MLSGGNNTKLISSLKGMTYNNIVLINIAINILMCRSHCDNDYPDMVCRGNYTKRAVDPPLLYNLHSDPGEIYTLDTKDPKYAQILKQITTVSWGFL